MSNLSHLCRARRALSAIAALSAMAAAANVTASCLPKNDAAPQPVAPFADDFDRDTLGPKYEKRGGTWSIDSGALHSSGEKNIPLWLDVPLSKNLRVEFDAWSKSPAVDTKVEIFGDGLRHESGYIVIFGGWNNSITTIARLDEHEKTRIEKRTKWKPNTKYHWRIERTDGRTLRFFVDDVLQVEYVDDKALFGPKNNRLGFTNWQSRVYYDNLRIQPLPGS